MKTTIKTVWELRSYDVWGNARDGFEVNDSHTFDDEYPLTLEVKTFNPGTDYAFNSTSPTDSQIRKAFGLGKCAIDTDGDDITIYVNLNRNGFPVGEMHCISHASLSPIRKTEAEAIADAQEE